MTALTLYPQLSLVLERTQHDSREDLEFTRTNQAAWHQELKAAATDLKAIDEIVSQTPEDPKDDQPGFWDWLERFVFLGGFGEPVQDFASVVAGRMIARLRPELRELLLNQLNNRKASFFFNGGRWLKADMIALNFSVEFFAAWTSVRFATYGNDMAVGDLWRLLQSLAEEKPEFALALARLPAFAAEADGRKFQIELLGGLRFRAGLPAAVTEGLSAVLEPMRSAPDAAERANYWRTLKRPLAQGRLPDADLELALAATADSQEELNVGFELAKSGARAPTLKAQSIRLLQWLSTKVEQPLTAGQQYDVATSVWLTAENVSPAELGFDVADLLVKIQPVDAVYRGIWQQVERALFALSQKGMPRVHRVLRALAHKQVAVLLKMLEPNAALYGVMSRLSEKPDETAAFAAELAGSKNAGERRLGFFLTESLQLPAPKEPESMFTEEKFSVWLAEFRINIVYRTMAQQLIRAAGRVDPSHTAMVDAFQQEVLYQCKSLPGLCLSQLQEKRAEVPLIEKPVAEAAAYFAALQALAKSPIRAMQIPGLRPALSRKRRIDAAEMEEAVAAHNIFEQFAKKSYLLYGTRWATFNGGVLGPETDLTSHSVATEYPRKTFIDPEGALLMQFKAQGDLRRLKPDVEDETP